MSGTEIELRPAAVPIDHPAAVLTAGAAHRARLLSVGAHGSRVDRPGSP